MACILCYYTHQVLCGREAQRNQSKKIKKKNKKIFFYFSNIKHVGTLWYSPMKYFAMVRPKKSGKNIWYFFEFFFQRHSMLLFSGIPLSSTLSWCRPPPQIKKSKNVFPNFFLNFFWRYNVWVLPGIPLSSTTIYTTIYTQIFPY